MQTLLHTRAQPVEVVLKKDPESVTSSSLKGGEITTWDGVSETTNTWISKL
ncbi:MAG: hypothetical protein AAFV97_03400 [Bacteroidota bacterium]